MMMYFTSFDHMWRNAVQELHFDAHEVPSRIGPTKEILGYCGVLTDIGANWLNSRVRRASAVYGAAELLWYLSGVGDAEMIKAYAPSYAQFAPTGEAYGAYGKRWADHDQLNKVVAELRRKPDTRQAVLTCWEPRDLGHQDPDMPCTLTLQFLIRDNRVNLIVNMRSNDVWLGMPYDVWCFTSLQKLVANELGLGFGNYYHRAGSLHAYEKNWNKLGEAAMEFPPLYNHVRHHSGGLTDFGPYVVIEQAIRANDLQGDRQKLIDELHPGLLAECVALCGTKWGLQLPRWVSEDLV